MHPAYVVFSSISLCFLLVRLLQRVLVYYNGYLTRQLQPAALVGANGFIGEADRAPKVRNI